MSFYLSYFSIFSSLQICLSVCEKLKSKNAPKDEDSGDIYDPLQEVCPGFAYMELLHVVPCKALPGIYYRLCPFSLLIADSGVE